MPTLMKARKRRKQVDSIQNRKHPNFERRVRSTAWGRLQENNLVLYSFVLYCILFLKNIHI